LTIFRLVTIAACLLAGLELGLGLDLVPDWLVGVYVTYLHYFLL